MTAPLTASSYQPYVAPPAPTPSSPSPQGTGLMAALGLLNQALNSVTPGPVMDYATRLKAELLGLGSDLVNNPERFAARTVGTGDIGAPLMGTITAFHGSPFDFPRFSSSEIGQGEGAQAFGHGLYFAGDPHVADFYRNQLSSGAPPVFMKHGKPMSYQDALAEYFTPGTIVPSYGGTDRVVKFHPGDKNGGWAVTVEAVRRNANGEWVSDPSNPGRRVHATAPSDQNLTASLSAKGMVANRPGYTYKAELPPDEHQLLDWDKPVAKQSPAVAASLGAFAQADETGAQFYKRLTRLTGSEKAASDWLHARGVPGIKYLDAASRKRGVGSMNYVMFKDEGINILEKNGVPQPR